MKKLLLSFVFSLSLITSCLAGWLPLASAPACPTTDPSWLNVALLLPFEGANGSTGAPGMTDVSSYAHGTGTVGGASTSITTAQKPYGTSSLLLVNPDSGNDVVTFPDSADWHLGTGKFTIEGWFRFNTSPAANLFIAQWPSGWAFFTSGGNNLILRASSGGDTTSYTFSPTLSTWYAWAVDRDASNVARVYINGTMVSKTTSYTANLSGSTSVLMIGSLQPGGFGGFNMDGWTKDVRITRNISRYASDSGYSVLTCAFPTSSDGSFTPTFSTPVQGNATGWGNATLRQVIPTASLSASSATQTRVTFSAGSSGGITNISNAFIGEKGAGTWDFNGSQVRITFNSGSNSSGAISASGSLVSDPINFILDKTQVLVIGADFAGGATLAETGLSGSNGGFCTGGQAGVTSPTGCSGGGFVETITQIEVK